MNKKVRMILPFAICGLFLLCDQLLKYIARTRPSVQWHTLHGWIGWEYFANPGIAFSLPMPNLLIIIITPIVLAALGYYVFARGKKTERMRWAVCLIFAGAVSNYLDRILFGVTIDYLRLLTSIINLADLLIVGGIFLLFRENLSSTSSPPTS